MHGFKELVHRHLKTSTTEEMEKLTCLVDELVNSLEDDKKRKFLIRVELLLNPHFNEETSKYVVSKLQNKDGSTGEHWNLTETTTELDKLDTDFDPYDWYVALNIVYSYHYKSGRSAETYIELASDLLERMDIKKLI
jgi:hypothetical protein